MDELAIHRELGRFDAEIGQLKEERIELKTELKEVKDEVKEIVRILTEAKGGWKTLVILGTVASVIGGLVATIIGFFIG